jgi:S-formylglutathione hydrolase FrmB
MKKVVQKRWIVLVAAAVFLLALVSGAAAQNSTSLKGSVQRIKVHGKGLEGNLSGDSPDRDVSIYLPPSYKSNPQKRYPVVYFLHGYTDDDAKWYGFQKHWINLPRIVDSVIAAGGKEMIFVTPNAYTKFQGSFYSNSVTTGNWEDFVAKELVAYIDAHFRTIAQAGSRGLAGHSMGGYGSMRIGQKHPDVFSSVYLLSPCCLMPPDVNASEYTGRMPSLDSATKAVKTIADFEKAEFYTKAMFALAAAWSPNPGKPPYYLDFPFENGQRNPVAEAKQLANMPLVTLDQYIFNLKQLQGLAFDAGTQDEPIATGIRKLDTALNNYGLKHDFEIYEGDHLNRIGERIAQKMLPFFSERLSTAPTQKRTK